MRVHRTAPGEVARGWPVGPRSEQRRTPQKRKARERGARQDAPSQGRPIMSETSTESFRVGEVVYDHLAQRTGRVVHLQHGAIDLVDARGTGWTADGMYPEGLEVLERPNLLVVAFEHPGLVAQRAHLQALAPLEQAVTLARGLSTGPRRRSRTLVSEPIASAELAREFQAGFGRAPGTFVEVLERLPDAEVDGRLRPDPRGVRVRLPRVGWLVERVIEASARPPRGDPSEPWEDVPLVRRGASAAQPHGDEEEARLLWALREVVRLEGLASARGGVDTARLNALRPRLWAVFRPSVVAHLERRTDPEQPWRDPEAAPDEAFELLLTLLSERTDLPRSVAGLAELLFTPDGGAEARRPSHALHCALYDCVDRLRREATRPLLRTTSFDPTLDDDGHVTRPAASLLAVPAMRDVGFRDLQRLLVELAPREDAAARMARARELLRAVRAAFLRGLVPLEAPERTATYRAILLDFLTLLDRNTIAALTGINYNTLRGWFPRSGEARTRPPRFVRGLVPDELAGFVRAFGRVFPILRLGLLPRQDEIDALVDDERVRSALTELFTYEDLDARGDFWRESALGRVARDLGQTETQFVELTLLPFLEDLVAERRARGLDRGAFAAPDAAPDELDHAALAILLLGAPDGRPLVELTAARTRGDVAARRRLAAEAGLGLLDLVDLELGRRWATPAELTELRRVLGPEADAALAGLRPFDAGGLEVAP